MKEKERLDVLLVELGMAESRAKAQATIMSGLVFVNGQRVDKPGTSVLKTAPIEVRGNTLKYVSRGGLKLEKAMSSFGLKLDGCVCGDIGASTGGFTDCMLQNGAVKVYAVDVGYGQLDWKLRSDERVVSLERTNARNLTHEEIPEELDFASVDVSFISLKLILPALARVLKSDGHVVCLVKPQFEAGKDKVGKKGVVRDPEVHKEVLETFLSMRRRMTLQCLRWTTLPSEALREILSILAISLSMAAKAVLLIWQIWSSVPTERSQRRRAIENGSSLSESEAGFGAEVYERGTGYSPEKRFYLCADLSL